MSAQKIFTKEPVILLVAVICTLLWGSAFPAIKLGYELFAIAQGDVPSKLVFAGVRFMLAGGLTLLIGSIWARRLLLPSRKSIGGITLLGLVQTGLEYLFYYIGVANTSGVKSAILNATSTFLSVILAHFCFKNDRITPQKTLGCALGFVGVVIINLGGGSLDGGFRLLGEGFVILAAVMFAVGAIISKQVAKDTDPMMITGWQLFIGGASLFLTGVAFGGQLAALTWAGFWNLAYLVILSSIAFSGWTILLKFNRVAKVSIYNFLTPVFGVLLSALLLGEAFFNVRNLAALLFVCAGILAVNRQRAEKSPLVS